MSKQINIISNHGYTGNYTESVKNNIEYLISWCDVNNKDFYIGATCDTTKRACDTDHLDKGLSNMIVLYTTSSYKNIKKAENYTINGHNKNPHCKNINTSSSGLIKGKQSYSLYILTNSYASFNDFYCQIL